MENSTFRIIEIVLLETVIVFPLLMSYIVIPFCVFSNSTRCPVRNIGLGIFIILLSSSLNVAENFVQLMFHIETLVPKHV